MSENKLNNKKLFSGAEIILQCLKNEGVTDIFGYPGGAILPFYDALYLQDDIKHILTRHEQAASHAAEGYARSTGKVGIMTVTSGPGATNAITGLTDAYMDSIPVICFSGQVPSGLIGTDAFQEADVTGLTRSCTKHNYLVTDVKDLAYAIHEAFHIAKTGRPGPVLIDIPKDVQNNKTEYHGKIEIDRPSYQIKKFSSEIDHKKIAAAVNLIKEAKKPLIYTGGGIVNSGEEARVLLKELVDTINSPVTNTLMGLGGFDAHDDRFLGMVGMHGTYESNMAMHQCDLLINIGARFDDRVTGRVDAFAPNSKKIHIDIDDVSIDKIINVDLSIISDAKNALRAIIAELKDQNISISKEDNQDWWQQLQKWKDVKSLSYKDSENDIIKPEYALETLNKASKSQKPYVSTDVGQHQMWTAQYMQFDQPKKWLTSGGLGTMGYGVPAAMGAQVANPDDLVICVSGDASFLMNMQELSTIRQYNLPIKIFIVNNRYMGMVRQWQELVYEKRESQSYMESLPDFMKLAETFDIKGITCDKASELEVKIQEMIDHDGPVLFNCLVDKAENVFPMIPAGAAHNEILLGSQAKEYVQKDINSV